MRRPTTAMTTMLLAATLAGGCDAGEIEAEGNVGPRGGVVVSEDGRLTVEIPSGALDRPVELRLEMVPAPQTGSMSPTYVLAPRGVHLARPAIVTYELEPSDMATAPDLSLWGRGAEHWSRLPDRFMDEEDAILVGTVLVFSEVLVAPDSWH